MAVQLAAVQLEGYYVRELTFSIRPGLEDELNCKMQAGIGFQTDGLFNPDQLTLNVQAGIAAHKDDPLRWQCMIHIESQNPPDRRYPYDFLAVLIGFFKVHEQVPPESIDSLIKINAASLLYSAAREVLANATGRGLFPHVLLPTVIFTVDDESEQKELPAPKKKAQTGGKRLAKKTAKKGSSKKKAG